MRFAGQKATKGWPGAGYPFVFALLVLMLSFTWPAPAQARPLQPDVELKIMLLGDLITSGTTAWASYRFWLYQDLLARGHTANFMGSIHGQIKTGEAPPACCRDFDWDHEGHSGYRVDDIIPLLPAWLNLNVPDIVLIHLGTNDIVQGQSASSTRAELDQIIDLVRAANPRVKILLAQIIPAKWGGIVLPNVAVLNASLVDLAAIKNQK